MSMQKDIIEKNQEERRRFSHRTQRQSTIAVCYGVEDRFKGQPPVYSYTEGAEFGHGRIETRTYNTYDGLEIIAHRKKWGGSMTTIEYESFIIKKSTGMCTSEKRLYVSSLPVDTPCPGAIVRNHWSIESMHRRLDVNLLQDMVKRKSAKAARNLDTIQRIVCNIFSAWKGLRKKKTDKKKGMDELMRHIEPGKEYYVVILSLNERAVPSTQNRQIA